MRYIFNSFDGGGFGMCHSKTGGGEHPDPNTRKRLSLKDGKRLPGKVRNLAVINFIKDLYSRTI